MTEPLSQYESPQVQERAPGWATGFIVFAATMMMLIGLFHILAGLAAILENEFYVAARNYVFEFDVSAWGWIHMILGAVVLVAGYSVLSGKVWARTVGITLAFLSAIANFMFIPYYPIWSLLIIALDIFVIWALAIHAGKFRE